MQQFQEDQLHAFSLLPSEDQELINATKLDNPRKNMLASLALLEKHTGTPEEAKYKDIYQQALHELTSVMNHQIDREYMIELSALEGTWRRLAYYRHWIAESAHIENVKVLQERAPVIYQQEHKEAKILLEKSGK